MLFLFFLQRWCDLVEGRCSMRRGGTCGPQAVTDQTRVSRMLSCQPPLIQRGCFTTTQAALGPPVNHRGTLRSGPIRRGGALLVS